MKKQIITPLLLIVLCVGMLSSFSAFASEIEGENTSASPLTTDPVILDAILETGTMVVDGSLNELSWTNWISVTGTSTAHPSGSVAMAWDKGHIYIAAVYENANSLWLNIGSSAVTVNLSKATVSGVSGATVAQKGNTVEVCLPMSALKICPADYNATISLKFGFANASDNTSASVEKLRFSGKIADLRPMTNYNGGWSGIGNTYRFSNVDDQTVHYAYSVSNAFSTTDTTWISQDLRFDDLPVTDGGFLNYLCAKGYYYYASRNCGDYSTTLSGDLFFVVVYNSGEGELKANIYSGSATPNAVIDLGVFVGEDFRLVTAWAADGSLKLFVNGNFVGGSNGSCTYRGRSCGDNVLTCRYRGTGTNENVSFQLKNVSVLKTGYSSVRGELTAAYLLNRADLDRVMADLPMKSAYETKHFEAVPVTWVTTDASVVETTGTIHRGEAEKKCKISLVHNGSTLWTKDVTLAPLGAADAPTPQRYFTAYADDIVIDGSLAGENWHMANKLLDADSILVGEMGAAWNPETLYVAVRNSGAAIDLNVNGKQIQLNQAEMATSGDYTEIAIPMKDIGVSVTGYGQEIAVSVTIGNGNFEGTLILSGTDWWGAGNVEDPLPVKPGNVKSVKYNGDQPDGNQGVVEVGNGWHLYDRYNATGTNPAGVRSYVLFLGTSPYQNFADRSGTTTVEFDFQALSMPVYGHDATYTTSTAAFACYGLNWTLADAANAQKYANVLAGGIYNTENGLYLALRGNKLYTYPLNREVGDLFRITMRWNPDHSLDVYIDGVLLDSIQNMSQWVASVGNTSFVINMLRNAEKPTSPDDDLDVYITNIAFGYAYSDNLLDTLSWENIKGNNSAADNVTDNLILTDNIVNEQLGIEYPLTWESSRPDIIDPGTGVVNRPESGAVSVSLTVSLDSDHQKLFKLVVLGKCTDPGNTLIVTNDTDPSTGAGSVLESVLFTFDAGNNSVIEDMGKRQTVNVVKLTDLDSYSRINRESVTLWISDDNACYTQIEDYKMTQVGQHWYLYDFEASGRYIKANYTHWEKEDSDFVAPLNGIIHGYWEQIPGTGEGQCQSKTYSFCNTYGKPMKDECIPISKSELGITGEDASIRVYLDNALLYHYIDEDIVYARVKDIAAGQSIVLTVKYGTAGAVDLANKEACLEITYGTRQTYKLKTGARWLLSIPAGTYGEHVVEKEMLIAAGGAAVQNGHMLVSYDQGITWSNLGVVSSEAVAMVSGDGASGGWIFDDATGAIFYETHNYKKFDAAWKTSDCVNVIIGSFDMGQTWELIDVIEPDTVDGNTYTYMLSYSDGIKVSSYDGEGPNVDFVFPTGAQYTDTGAFCCRIAYSDDGGRSWKMSPSLLTFGEEKGHESGLSEGWILENDEGVLVLYSRCQFAEIVNFAKAYSYDFGRTWTSFATKSQWEANKSAEGNKITALLSTVYATNTQALMYEYMQYNGIEAPLFLWGGNTTFGGTSYIRTPMNVAVSYDGLETWRNIQNLFSETYMDVYGAKGRSIITNHSVKKVGKDTMVLTFNGQWMVATDFENWFYRTKGAYDAFESGNPFYEGWSTNAGLASNTGDMASKGMQSLHLDADTIITRSVPYLQDGTVALDVYVGAETSGVLALQPAFGVDPGTYTLASIQIKDGKLDTGRGNLTLREGWNTLQIRLALTDAQAWVCVNGSESVPLKLDIAAGDYVCYFSVFAETDLHIDEFTVVSHLDAEIYTGETQKNMKPAVVKYVENLIKEIGAVTLEDAEAIAAARAAYDALTEEEKAQVSNYDVLLAAEEALKKLQEQNLPRPSISLTLNESIDMNFYLKKADIGDDFTLVVKRNGEVLEEGRYTLSETADDRYRVRVSINADKMCDEITIQAFDAAGKALSQERTESVRSYVKLRLANASAPLEEKCALIRMLDYGTLAQMAVAGGEVADPANSVLTEAERAMMDEITWPEATAAADAAAGDKAGSKFSVSLTANETIDMNLYIAKADMKDGYTIQVKRNGTVLTTGQYQLSETADGRYRVRVSMNADKMNDVISVQVMKADGTAAYAARSLSVRHFVTMRLNNATALEVEKSMLIALVDYGTLVQMAAAAKAGTTVTDPANRYVTATHRTQYDVKWN